MKKSKLSIVVLSALLIAGVAVVKNQNCKSIVYDNVEALTGGDNGNKPNTHKVCYKAKDFCQDNPSWYFKTDKNGNLTDKCTVWYDYYRMQDVECTEEEE